MSPSNFLLFWGVLPLHNLPPVYYSALLYFSSTTQQVALCEALKFSQRPGIHCDHTQVGLQTLQCTSLLAAPSVLNGHSSHCRYFSIRACSATPTTVEGLKKKSQLFTAVTPSIRIRLQRPQTDKENK